MFYKNCISIESAEAEFGKTTATTSTANKKKKLKQKTNFSFLLLIFDFIFLSLASKTTFVNFISFVSLSHVNRNGSNEIALQR